MSDDTFERFRDVFVDIMDLDDPTLTAATSAHDYEEWDSLSHVRLLVALEREFAIKFTNAEIESFDNVGDLVDAINRKAE